MLRLARPLPVEWLLVTMSASAPVTPQYTFTVGENSFPIENRPMEGHLQDFRALANHRMHLDLDDVGSFFRDFHLVKIFI
jgi:nuclear protein localization family protein 4